MKLFYKFFFISRLFCSKSSILTEINLDNNLIESVTDDPFKYCKNIKLISISYNLLQRLPQGKMFSWFYLDFKFKFSLIKDFFLIIISLFTIVLDFLRSLTYIEKLILSHNALTEFRDEILSKHLHLTVLDLSHNLITTLKLNKVV